MKIIVTGATGTIGSAVLQQAIENPAVTSIIALTRRPVDTSSTKVKNIIHTDFLQYDDAVVSELKGAQACIWALGSPTSGKVVHIDYTLAAIDMCQTRLVPELKKGQKFRFVYTSGGAVPYLETVGSFLFGAIKALGLRAQLDRDICAVADKNPQSWESVVVRPWFVRDDAPTLPMGYILRPELGAAMVDAALNGCPTQILPNAEAKAKGQAVLKQQKL